MVVAFTSFTIVSPTDRNDHLTGRPIDRNDQHPRTIMSQKAILDKLARYRTVGARNSDQVLELGDRALRGGSLGDQGECRLCRIDLKWKNSGEADEHVMVPIQNGP
jgi:hypothetical protein